MGLTLLCVTYSVLCQHLISLLSYSSSCDIPTIPTILLLIIILFLALELACQ